MENCLFCNIASKTIPAEIIFENEEFLALLDINPINPGHTLLIPKAHHENIHDLPDNLLAKIGPLLQKISNAVKTGTNAEGINIGMNNGGAAGQEVYHAHIHIMPRYVSDKYKMWSGEPYKNQEEIKKWPHGLPLAYKNRTTLINVYFRNKVWWQGSHLRARLQFYRQIFLPQ